ncbi:unnamed protein product [Rangifer tarandus platyrhynchus]|uniref:Uncharacterized protein n=2 Tax=Rangifer tarandus platyrhynchus TaxID=3082113 RepID=A0ABN8Z515_RANTA|nr:unnamed protein product [Rangifer tarandus platyrhynchus]CAI9704076.1 unnamed protein product [Rangifer tarandus platyrhynchus]
MRPSSHEQLTESGRSGGVAEVPGRCVSGWVQSQPGQRHSQDPASAPVHLPDLIPKFSPLHVPQFLALEPASRVSVSWVQRFRAGEDEQALEIVVLMAVQHAISRIQGLNPSLLCLLHCQQTLSQRASGGAQGKMNDPGTRCSTEALSGGPGTGLQVGEAHTTCGQGSEGEDDEGPPGRRGPRCLGDGTQLHRSVPSPEGSSPPSQHSLKKQTRSAFLAPLLAPEKEAGWPPEQGARDISEERKGPPEGTTGRRPTRGRVCFRGRDSRSHRDPHSRRVRSPP